MGKPLNNEPVTRMDALVFGGDAKRHTITGMLLEVGSGALPAEQQAEGHCYVIEQTEGKQAADAMRRKLAAARRPLAIVVRATEQQ